MLKRRNPAAGKRQGFGTDRDLDKPFNILADAHQQPQFDVVALLAQRTGIATATVRLHCEAFGIGGPA